MSGKLFDLEALILEVLRLGRHLPESLRSLYYWRLFCTPFLHKRQPEQLAFLATGKPFFVPSGPNLLQGWVFGTKGPTAILCHGWQGSAASWYVIGPELLKAGFRVVVFNAPGHHSGPRRSSLPDFARALKDIIETWGADFLIGHSLGAMTVARVAASGLPALKGMVLFSSPDDLKSLATGFCLRMGMQAKDQARFEERLALHGDRPLAQEAVSVYLRSVRCPILLIHDSEDQVTPVTNSRRLAQLHELTLTETTGWGHRAIIRQLPLAQEAAGFGRQALGL